MRRQSLLAGIVLLVGGLGARAWAQEQAKPVAPIYPVGNAIKVDGEVVDWEWAPSFGFGKFAFPIVIPDYGQVAAFMARYDQQALYVAFKINDPTPAVNKRRGRERWQGDQVELLLCTDPRHHAQHSFKFTEYDYQMFLGPSADGPPSVYVLQNAAKNDYLLPGSEAGVMVWPDGKGWSLEAKIPWASLSRPDYFRPEPGLQIPWQIQIDLGAESGEILGYAVKWHPFGIHFQNPTSWAWARLLDAQETIMPPEVAPEEAPKPAGRAEIRFSLPAGGLVSLNALREDGTLIRRLLIGKRLEAGEHAVTWDGLDEEGKPVAPGSYRFLGSVANLQPHYLTTIGNTSPEPYGGCYSSVGGEYRHGAWHDVVVNPDGTFYVLNDGGEGPPSIQLIDPANRFAVKWGGGTAISGNDFQQVGARDGQYLYFIHWYGHREGQRDYSGQMLSRMLLARHEPVRFGSGDWTVRVTPERETGRWEVTDWEVRGLGAYQGQVFVPLFSEDRVDIYDGEQGSKIGSLSEGKLNGPSDVWPTADGVLYVVDKRSVHRFGADGKYLDTPVQGLRQGWAVACDATGRIFVSDFGTHEVKVYDARGQLLRILGKTDSIRRQPYLSIWDGWRWVEEKEGFSGAISDDSFFRPQGIAVDTQGNLLVCDSGNARVQYFGSDWRLRKSLVAGIYSVLAVDPEKPETVFISSQPRLVRQYQIDWNTGKHSLQAQFTPVSDAPMGTNFVKFRGNQPYLFTNYVKPVWTIENGKVRLCCNLGVAGYGGWGYGAYITVEEDGKVVGKYLGDQPEWKDDPPAAWEWRDTNRDGRPQLGEYTIYRKSEAQPWWRTAYPMNYFVEDDWSVQGKVDEGPEGRYIRFPFGGFDPAGNPIYSWKTAQLVFQGDQVDPAWTADLSGGKPLKPSLGGAHYTKDGWMYLVLNDRPEFNPRDCRFRVYTPEGKRLFSIMHGVRGFWDKPGEELGFSMQMTRPVDDKIFLTETYGSMHVFSRDGLYLGTLLEQSDAAPQLKGKDARYQPYGEMWYAHVFRHPKTRKVYLIAQPNAQPLVLLYEVTGLDAVRRFQGSCELVALPPGES